MVFCRRPTNCLSKWPTCRESEKLTLSYQSDRLFQGMASIRPAQCHQKLKTLKSIMLRVASLTSLKIALVDGDECTHEHHQWAVYKALYSGCLCHGASGSFNSSGEAGTGHTQFVFVSTFSEVSAPRPVEDIRRDITIK